MYNASWHIRYGAMTTSSSEVILDIVAAFADLGAVLDLGCGDGHWLSVCERKGAKEISGVDGPWTNMDQLMVRRESVLIRDLSAPLDLGRRFDLAMSLEVAEHLAQESAEVFVDNLVRHSDVVLFGAAIPFQDGLRHINEQWQSYWSDLFVRRGYRVFDPIRGQIWERPEVHYWYKQNILVYVREANAGAVERISNYIREASVNQLPLDIVHPEKFFSTASYRQIAFRRLIKELPKQTLLKVIRVVRGQN